VALPYRAPNLVCAHYPYVYYGSARIAPLVDHERKRVSYTEGTNTKTSAGARLVLICLSAVVQRSRGVLTIQLYETMLIVT
jgi:hypothetical protein